MRDVTVWVPFARPIGRALSQAAAFVFGHSNSKTTLTWLTYTTVISIMLSVVLVMLAVVSDALCRRRRRRTGGGPGRSGIYYGRVWHDRFKPAVHRFTYPVFYCLLDLDEVESVAMPWYMWPVGSARLPALARFRASDHLKGSSGPGEGVGKEFGGGAPELANRVRDMVHKTTGTRPTGRVQLLTHLAYLGYCFNPVSFYYCLDESEERIETVVGEVSNTPWGEMHCYVLNPKTEGVELVSRDKAGAIRYRFDKEFHVSPFMSMKHTYDWRFFPPSEAKGSRLNVQTTLLEAGGEHHGKIFFDARLMLKRRDFTAATLCWHLLLYPMYTVWVQILIHYEAFRLWWKKIPFFPHPAGAESAGSRLVGAIMTPLFNAQEAWDARRRRRSTLRKNA